MEIPTLVIHISRIDQLMLIDDSNLVAVYHVLLHLHKRLTIGDFFRLIESGGPKLVSASRLLEVYAREQNREMLRDFYYSDDRWVESAVLSLDEAASRLKVCRSQSNLVKLSSC